MKDQPKTTCKRKRLKNSTKVYTRQSTCASGNERKRSILLASQLACHRTHAHNSIQVKSKFEWSLIMTSLELVSEWHWVTKCTSCKLFFPFSLPSLASTHSTAVLITLHESTLTLQVKCPKYIRPSFAHRSSRQNNYISSLTEYPLLRQKDSFHQPLHLAH